MQSGWINGLQMAAVLMVFLIAMASLSGASSTTDPLVTDITISDAVEDELFLDASIRAHLIDVSTMEGVVILSGNVDNLLAKQRAERIAETVKGVRAVVNTIKVLPPILRSDSEIKADVKGALLADPATDSFDIDVKINDNVVTLTGSVSSWQEREIAAKVAMGVKGVKNLRNDLVFSYTSNRPDNDIQQDVNQAFRWVVLVPAIPLSSRLKFLFMFATGWPIFSDRWAHSLKKNRPKILRLASTESLRSTTTSR